MYEVIKCIIHAAVGKFKSRKMGLKKQHWLDYADDKYDTQMISDVKSLLSVLTMFLPTPFYWALSGQQGSRWTLQATQLNNSVGGYKIEPDQMQVSNAILGIIIVPFLDYVIYPSLNKCNLLTRPLQRMTIGGLLVSSAFVTAGFLQLSIERNFKFYGIETYKKFDIIKNLPVEKLQLHGINCSLYEMPNTSLESEPNQIIKCLENNKTTFFIQPNEKFINSTHFSSPVTFSSLSILLQIPQYFLLSCGEVMFLITSTGFAYSQAPKTMKTILPALLLVNNALGNIIVMVVTELNLFQRQSYEFFFYAILLPIVIFIFSLLARNYKYKKQDGE